MEKNRRIQGLLAFREIGGLGRKRRRAIFEAMGADGDTTYFEMLIMALELRYLSPTMPIGDFTAAWEKANRIMKRCAAADIQIKTVFDPDFPEVLRFDDGPDLIYYRGNLKTLDNPNRAAVIGTRAPSKEGADQARLWGRELAEAGYTVVSGLAAGCDTAGHRGCLDAGGQTVAFLPSSIDQIVPRENAGLAQEIVNNGGCLISEYSPLETVSAYMFIERDRLQAQTSKFLLTSEFEDGSGTLHTLDDARKMGRTIHTTPEIAFRSAEGFRTATKSGIAYQVTAAEDFPALFEKLKG